MCHSAPRNKITFSVMVEQVRRKPSHKHQISADTPQAGTSWCWFGTVYHAETLLWSLCCWGLLTPLWAATDRNPDPAAAERTPPHGYGLKDRLSLSAFLINAQTCRAQRQLASLALAHPKPDLWAPCEVVSRHL